MKERFGFSPGGGSFTLLNRPTKILPSLLLLTWTCSVHAQDRVATARAQIEALIARSGAEVAMVWRPLDAKPGEEIVINPTLRFHAASTMKVPIMIELYRQRDAGALKLDDTMTVTNTFHSIVDGSEYTLSASEDSDSEVYKHIGKPLALSALCEAAITVSSNLAANNLIERLGAAKIQKTVDALGASGMQVKRGVEDLKAFDKGENNTTDAAGLATLFAKIARGEAAAPAATSEMIATLKRQKFNAGIPSKLPTGIEVAHKTGTVTRVHHDAGVVYASRPYVLVVLTRGLETEAISDALIAEISRIAFEIIPR